MYVCISCVPGAHGGQKRASDIMELVLQMVVTQGIENLHHLEEQAVPLTPKPSLQPLQLDCFRLSVAVLMLDCCL